MLSFFKSESKAITIPDRPPPPSYEQIKEDVEATPDNDIMFRSRLRTESESSDEYFDALSEIDTSGDVDMEAEQERVYDQVVELLQLHQRLITAPESLESELKKLKALGHDVSEAVTDLREMSQSFVHGTEETVEFIKTDHLEKTKS
ncbi:uncharacterized protein LOC111126291 [Crassostrea virginica]